jgi:serine O-acetyltransferase
VPVTEPLAAATHDDPEMVEQAKPHTRGCLKSFSDVRRYLAADLYRYEGKSDARAFFKHYFFTPGFKYTVWMRLVGYLRMNGWAKYGLYQLAKLNLLRLRYKFGIAIPYYTQIGPGLMINRFGGIYVGGDCVIGSNVNITAGVLLGYTNRGKRRGCPRIGNNVFLGNSAKVVGNVDVGNGCAIGVNALVIDDLPENSVVAAPTGTIVSTRGSGGYINRTVEPF